MITPVSLGSANTTSSSSPLTMTGGVNIQAGDLVVVGFGNWHGNTSSSVTLQSVSDGTNTYTLAIAESQRDGSSPGQWFDAEIWYCLNAKAVTNPTITATVTAGESWQAAAVVAARVPGGASALDITASTGANTGTPSLSSGTLASPIEVIFGVSCVDSSGALTAHSPFTQLVNPFNADISVDIEYDVVSSTSAVTFAPTWTSTVYESVLASFKLLNPVQRPPLKTYLRR